MSAFRRTCEVRLKPDTTYCTEMEPARELYGSLTVDKERVFGREAGTLPDQKTYEREVIRNATQSRKDARLILRYVL